jgi:hypothetical protein
MTDRYTRDASAVRGGQFGAPFPALAGLVGESYSNRTGTIRGSRSSQKQALQSGVDGTRSPGPQSQLQPKKAESSEPDESESYSLATESTRIDPKRPELATISDEELAARLADAELRALRAEAERRRAALNEQPLTPPQSEFN